MHQGRLPGGEGQLEELGKAEKGRREEVAWRWGYSTTIGRKQPCLSWNRWMVGAVEPGICQPGRLACNFT